MKRFLTLALLMALPLAVLAQDITGTWNGSFMAGSTRLRVYFHFERDGDTYTGTMDSPDQRLRGLELSAVTFDPPELTVEMAALDFVYRGTLEDDETITGSFSQQAGNFPLDMKKGEFEHNRPQTPQPPYPYHSEDITFENKGAGVTLAGTLTMPLSDGIFPAVILVTGSGAQNRDEEILHHKPFLVIADHLTRNGIAVLRYDDRGFGESTGSFKGSTTLDFAGDALAAFDYLRTRGEIVPGQIGILGHSEGGTIAFMAASEQPELGFIISLAGSILPMDSTLILQNRALLLSAGFGEGIAQEYCEALGEVFRILKEHDQEYIEAHMDEFNAAIDSHTSLPSTLRENLSVILRLNDPWLLFSLAYDTTPAIENTRCPVLALNGDKDMQVDAAANLGYLEEVMRRVGNNNYETRSYPEMNHLFQQCVTGAVTEYEQIEQTISPQVLDDITEWIQKVTK